MPKYRKKLSEFIDEKLDLEIRDAKIITLWDHMKHFMKDWSYSKRISYLRKEYHLSGSAIEKIVNDYDKG